jgi:hypothetical protein
MALSREAPPYDQPPEWVARGRGLRPPKHKWLASPPIRAHSINIEINFAFYEILQFEAKQILPAVSCRLNE